MACVLILLVLRGQDFPPALPAGTIDSARIPRRPTTRPWRRPQRNMPTTANRQLPDDDALEVLVLGGGDVGSAVAHVLFGLGCGW